MGSVAISARPCASSANPTASWPGSSRPSTSSRGLGVPGKLAGDDKVEGASTTAESPAGFTLLEILVAMVVLALMMVGLTQGVHLGIKAVDRQAAALGVRADLDGVDRVLRDLITHIDPGGGRSPVQIEGDQEHFHFISRLPSAVALLTRRADMTLLVDDDHRLVLRWRPALHETSFVDPPDPTDTVLLDHVDKVEFAYWAPDDGSNQPAGWRDEWNSPYLPFVVRIKISFPDGDKRHFPDILVSPLLEQPGG